MSQKFYSYKLTFSHRHYIIDLLPTSDYYYYYPPLIIHTSFSRFVPTLVYNIYCITQCTYDSQ